jgi:hypothetical protein
MNDVKIIGYIAWHGGNLIPDTNAVADTVVKRNATGGATVTDLECDRVFNTGGADFAEGFNFDKNDKPLSGLVYIQTENGLIPSSKRAQKGTIGIYSDTYAQCVNSKDLIDINPNGSKIPICLAGRVKVYVKEKLEIGDALVSDVKGFATKARWYERLFFRERIIGIVFEPSKDKEIKRISILK